MQRPLIQMLWIAPLVLLGCGSPPTPTAPQPAEPKRPDVSSAPIGELALARAAKRPHVTFAWKAKPEGACLSKRPCAVELKTLGRDKDGSFWIGGNVAGRLVFDGTTLESPGMRDSTLLHVAASGKLLQATRYGGGYSDSIDQLVVEDDRILVVGDYESDFSLGGAPLPVVNNPGLSFSEYVGAVTKEGKHLFSTSPWNGSPGTTYVLFANQAGETCLVGSRASSVPTSIAGIHEQALQGPRPDHVDRDLLATVPVEGHCYDSSGRLTRNEALGNFRVLGPGVFRDGKAILLTTARDPNTLDMVLSAIEFTDSFKRGSTLELSREPPTFWRYSYPATATTPAHAEVVLTSGWSASWDRWIATGPRGAYVVVEHPPAMSTSDKDTSELLHFLPDGRLAGKVRILGNHAPGQSLYVTDLSVDADGLPVLAFAVDDRDLITPSEAANGGRRLHMLVRLTEDLRLEQADLVLDPSSGGPHFRTFADGLYQWTEEPGSVGRVAPR